MFSIIIPLYNKEVSIRNTIQSVLDQSFQDFEIIVVNDGSTDRSADVVAKIDEPKIRLIHQKNQGVSTARNKGIEESQRDWIVFLDGDDLWEKNHLEVLKDMIEQYPQDKVFCTSFIKSNQHMPAQNDNSIVVIENYFKEVINHNFFWTSVTCLHKSVFTKVGVFVRHLSRGEDMELWTRVGREYRFIKSNQITAIYCIDAENRSDLSFNLCKSRAYYYDFKSSTSSYETIYYRSEVARVLRFLLAKKQFLSCFKLFNKHYKHLKIRDLIKKGK